MPTAEEMGGVEVTREFGVDMACGKCESKVTKALKVGQFRADTSRKGINSTLCAFSFLPLPP
jgi:hypothetical protein